MIRSGRKTARMGLGVTGLLVTLSLMAPTPAVAATRPSGKLMPPTGALFGAYVDPDAKWTGEADALAEVAAFEDQIGRTLDVNHHYYAWTNSFPTGLENADVAAGRIPLISWDGTSLDPILSGQHDAMIRSRAEAVVAFGAPVFLRWGWEMNGNWSPHDGTNNNDPGKHNGPAKYVDAWRHIHDLFQAEGATNVAWVWAPNGSDVPADNWNHWTQYYPGDGYVDWVGIDAYNWGNTRTWSSWMSFTELFQPIYSDYEDRKPIMIAETASVEQGGNKAAWISSTRQAIKSAFPSIGAFVWFHTDKEVDWRANSSGSSLTAYKAMANDPYFGGSGQPGDDDDVTSPKPPKLQASVSPKRPKKATHIRIRLAARSTTTVLVRSPKAGVIRYLRKNVEYAPGLHQVKWNLRKKNGKLVPPGRYKIVVKAHNPLGKDLRAKRVRVID